MLSPMLRVHGPYNGMCTSLLLVPKLWTCRNSTVGTVGRPLAPLAGHWHTIFFPDENSQIVRFRTWVMPGQPLINEENLEGRSQQSNQNQQKEGNNHQLMTPRTPAIFSNNYKAGEPDSPTLQTKHTNTLTDPVPTPQETGTVSKETMIN